MNSNESATDPLPDTLLNWAIATVGGGEVESSSAERLAGGAVSDLVERITLHVRSSDRGLRSVNALRKHCSRHEIAGLQAAQAVRPAAAAIPELIASADEARTPWLITAWCEGEPLRSRDAAIPMSLFDSLARLHSHHQSDTIALESVPRVDPEWWAALCCAWVLPRVAESAGRHPLATLERAKALVADVAQHRAVRTALSRLEPTLLHGDVHPGNVIVDGRRATLIDWGSARIGPAMLDLANIVGRESPEFAAYAATWLNLTGRPIDGEQVELGYRWSALQLPIQYLPWTLENLPTQEIDSALARAQQALRAL